MELVTDVEDFQAAAYALGKAVDAGDVRRHDQDPPLPSEQFAEFEQRISRRLNVLKHVMQVDQVPLPRLQGLWHFIDGANPKVVNAATLSECDELVAQFAAGNGVT